MAPAAIGSRAAKPEQFTPKIVPLVFSAVPGATQFFVGQRLVDQLVDAKVVKIERGILLGGWEEHSGKPPTRQTWWCLPGLFDDTTIYP